MRGDMLGDAENTLVLILSYGTVAIELFPDVAPETVERIKLLAGAGVYDDVAFHRVIPGFVAQTGDIQFGNLARNYDPDRVGTGGSSLPDVVLESSDISFQRGVVGMARSADPDSGNSQFYITYDDASFLDGEYTVFGEVIDGMRFVDQIKPGTGSSGAVQGTPDRMLSTFIADELAEGATSVGTRSAELFPSTSGDGGYIALGGDDTIKAGGGVDRVLAGNGNDLVLGQGGGDRIFGEAGNDTLVGGGGNDSLSGSSGRDVIRGGGGKDTLLGGSAGDRIEGGKGADQLNGGTGNDTMIGGAGRDKFIFDRDAFGKDEIVGGFELGRDIIDFSATELTQDDLTLRERGANTVVLTPGNAQIKIEGVTGLVGNEDSIFEF